MRIEIGLGARSRVSMLALAGLLMTGGAAAAQSDAAAEGERLGATIDRAIRAQGPFFTAEERAVIERHCGYAPGSWDGFDFNMIGGTLHCENGRRVDHPEVQATMEAAAPRIDRRVRKAMARPDVRAAIARAAATAEAEALAGIDQAELAREAAAAAREAAQEVRRDLRERRPE